MLIIKPTVLNNAHFIELVRQLDAYQSAMYPAESDYSMPLEEMLANEHYAFIAEVNGVAAGCACLYICDDGLAEIKRVYVNPQFRGLGIADRLMAAVEAQALQLQLPSLYLETGVDHLAAIGLYKKRGFVITDCFGEYTYDPLSVYMVKPLAYQQRA
ncbi:GNAT family N-acetyltransferase [Serratia sp. M24T3]|uniref:GNAT family N-acetyltransferase n=1 Tax=Rouxiella sp. WC2420 TaxID=3234145 RepID=A0AB39VN67_9GAMM|nr:GNAT family N-acetyltransferase [Serratia sp. M24T3]EIC84374.1 GCN5-like N-acetyltransferase [Serratia sp. M24T3]